jgi:transcriptional regulator with GAF, ATPase, and Fis domain
MGGRTRRPPARSGIQESRGTLAAEGFIHRIVDVEPLDREADPAGIERGTRRSRRANRALIKVNCAAVPRDLYEAEFFGHVRGAFTGAVRERAGRFELADNGTLFLDEIGEIPLELRAKLLRVIQDGEFERVREECTRKVDVRLITATNRDLRAEAEAGRFRQDLYYRLSVFSLEVPPLRKRKEDIPLLAGHFLQVSVRKAVRPRLPLTTASVQRLQQYHWPGNVRELQHVIERAVIISTGSRLIIELPSAGSAPSLEMPAACTDTVWTDAQIRQFEADNIRAALKAAKGQVAGPGGVAQRLGLKPTTLASRTRALKIRPSGPAMNG